MPETVLVEWPDERAPTLAERVMLLSIEQSRMNWQGQTSKAFDLGNRMLEEVSRAAGLSNQE